MTAPDAPLQPVAVVVVAHNSGPALRHTVARALAERPLELVVVDNGSHDGCTEFLAQPAETAHLAPSPAPGAAGSAQGSAADAQPRVQRLRLAHNAGFAEGCNRGVAASAAPYVLLLNDDAVLRPGYLRELVAALACDARAASAIGKVVYCRAGAQYVDSAGIALVRHALRPQDVGQDELDRGQHDGGGTIFAPTGAAVLYRRSAYVGAGGLRAELFAYYEDVDLGWRLGRAGWRHLYVPRAVAEHRRRGPAGKPLAIEAKAFVNRYQVWAANEPLRAFCRYAPVALAWESARLLRLAWRRPRLAGAIVRRAPGALARGLRARAGTAAEPC